MAASTDTVEREAKLQWMGKFESGEIAAMSSSYNSLVQLIAQDYKYRSLLPPVDPEDAYPEVPLVVRKDLYDTNPQVVVGLARAMDKALVFAKANPDAALAIMKQAFPPDFRVRPVCEQMPWRGFDPSNSSMRQKSSSRGATEETAASAFAAKSVFPAAAPTAATEETAGM